MTAAAKAVVILIPDPEALVRIFRSGKVSEVEEVGAHEALVRAREWAFGRKVPPSWLLYGLDVLGCEIPGEKHTCHPTSRDYVAGTAKMILP